MKKNPLEMPEKSLGVFGSQTGRILEVLSSEIVEGILGSILIINQDEF